MKELYLPPSFFWMTNRREEGSEGKEQDEQKKSRKIVVFAFIFCLCFLSFLNKGQKKDNKAKKGFEKKKG
jgi:hypothetical protein